MKKTNVLFSLTVIALLIGGCKQDESESPVTYPDYGRLQVGNYWIYQRFVVDSFGNETPTEVYDSCFVEKDTLINGNTYAKINRPWPWGTLQRKEFEYLRDSLHYIVTPTGSVQFSSEDFITTFVSYFSIKPDNGDTIYNATRKMAEKDLLINTPAGDFITSNCKTTYKIYPPYGIYSFLRYSHRRYSKNIGLVVETLPIFASVPTTTERRLVRYHLAPLK